MSEQTQRTFRTPTPSRARRSYRATQAHRARLVLDVIRMWWPSDDGEHLIHAYADRTLPTTVRGCWRACFAVGHRADAADAVAVQRAALRIALAGAHAAATSGYSRCDERFTFAAWHGQDDAFDELKADAAALDTTVGAA